MIQFITPAKRSFPGEQDSSPAFTARQRNFPRQVQQPGAVVRPQKLNSRASVIAKEELYHRLDRSCSFKSDPRSVVRPIKKSYLRCTKKNISFHVSLQTGLVFLYVFSFCILSFSLCCLYQLTSFAYQSTCNLFELLNITDNLIGDQGLIL